MHLCVCHIVIEKHGGSICDVIHRFLNGDFAACRFRFTTYLSLGPAGLGDQKKSGWRWSGTSNLV